jgi:hypothetical protein
VYATAFAATYLRGASSIVFEERYFRYAGILFFLLLLIAIDQWGVRFAKGLACLLVIVLGLFGLKNSVTGAHAQMRYYDPTTGISQDISPAVLEYLRSEMTQNKFQRPIALISTPTAYISLPRFRILHPIGNWMGYKDGTKWAGRAEKIFVVLPETLEHSRAEAILRLLTGYEFDMWNQTKLDGMIIYTQCLM